MAKLLLFLFCIVVAPICAVQGEREGEVATVNFTFPPQAHLKPEGDAYFDGNNLIELNRYKDPANLQYVQGWVTYAKSVPLWDKLSGSVTNFSTHFQFIMDTAYDELGRKGWGSDGLAFFLAPFDLAQPSAAEHGGFGIFNNATTYPMVAVEFDTFQNEWDLDDNHVGIDVSSVVSNITRSLSSTNRTDKANLNNGEQWDAWVDYDGEAMTLNVFLLHNPGNNRSKPQQPILSYDINLSNFLPERVKVGLSASIAYYTERHSISFWSFTSQNSSHLSTSAPPKSRKNQKRTVKIAFISVLVPIVAICGVILWWCYFWNRKVGTPAGDDVELDECFAQGPRRFAYAELAAATGNFSEENKLGQGGFGGVFKGTLAGSMVAVKKISEGSKQGRKEYISEVTIISKLRHRNLVQLLGWCHDRGDLLLVYEFLPNGSLDKYIFKDCEVNLNWNQRYSIACDIASALVYLHEEWEQRVVHRDVKASNVMLDSNFSAKLGDFGLARVQERDRTTSHSTVAAGTFGYVAPECVVTRKASPEADVFSFGAVILGIACGRRPVDESLDDYNYRLVEWVWHLHSQDKILDAADEKLNGNFDEEEMKRVMAVGLLCSHPNYKARPPMRQVLMILKSETELPAFSSNFPVVDDSLRQSSSLNASPWSAGKFTTW